MGTWYNKDGIKISLYSRSQKHGNHNYSHFHVSDHGENCVFIFDGSKQEGHCKNEDKIRRMILRNQDHILRQIDLLDRGIDCEQVDDDINNK